MEHSPLQSPSPRSKACTTPSPGARQHTGVSLGSASKASWSTMAPSASNRRNMSAQKPAVVPLATRSRCTCSSRAVQRAARPAAARRAASTAVAPGGRAGGGGGGGTPSPSSMSAPAGEHHDAPVTLSRPRLNSAKSATMALLSCAATRTRDHPRHDARARIKRGGHQRLEPPPLVVIQHVRRVGAVEHRYDGREEDVRLLQVIVDGAGKLRLCVRNVVILKLHRALVDDIVGIGRRRQGGGLGGAPGCIPAGAPYTKPTSAASSSAGARVRPSATAAPTMKQHSAMPAPRATPAVRSRRGTDCATWRRAWLCPRQRRRRPPRRRLRAPQSAERPAIARGDATTTAWVRP